MTEFLASVFSTLTIDEPMPQEAVAANPGTRGAKGTGPHRDERRAACRDFLTKWCVDCWFKNHADEVWGPDLLLPDKVLTKLAATASLQTKEDIRSTIEGWWLWEIYSQEILDGLRLIDMRFEAIKARKEADRLEQQQIERERRMAIAHAEQQRLLEEKERKRLLKEEEKRQKDEEKRRKDEEKRWKNEEKKEAKRQKDEAKEEAKRQREKVTQQKEAAKEAKRQREEAAAKRKREEEEMAGARCQSGEHEAKRQRANSAPFTPTSSSSTPLPATPTQPIPTTRPRPRPTRRLPPANGATSNGTQNE